MTVTVAPPPEAADSAAAILQRLQPPPAAGELAVTQDLDFLALIWKASPFAQGVLLLLTVLLYFSLWYILRKRTAYKRISRLCDRFERHFWSGTALTELEAGARRGDYGTSGLSQIFLAGHQEYRKLHSAAISDSEAILESVRRAMNITTQQEIEKLQSHLAFLATVGSVSPYIGLLGTVWGIINAFRSLANVSQATLAHVAPGIAEALIATAMGLFAAIPAVVAYNFFTRRMDRFIAQFENFIDQFSNILRRNL